MDLKEYMLHTFSDHGLFMTRKFDGLQHKINQLESQMNFKIKALTYNLNAIDKRME